MEEKKIAKNIVRVNIKADSIFISESGMPQLKIDVDMPEQIIDKFRHPKRHMEYWMSPFRLYKFQISGGPHGEGDCGSCEVVNLHHVIEVLQVSSTPDRSNVCWGDKNEPGNIIHTVFKGMANTALVDFLTKAFRGYDGYSLKIENYPDIKVPGEFNIPFMYMDALDAFVFASIIYIRQKYEYKNIPEYQVKWLKTLPELNDNE